MRRIAGRHRDWNPYSESARGRGTAMACAGPVQACEDGCGRCRAAHIRKRLLADVRSSGSVAMRGSGGAYAPPNVQTGMPSFLALSARLAEMPEPGKAMTPVGSTSRIWSLRLNGAALLWRDQLGLNAICGTLRLVVEIDPAGEGDLRSGREQR